MPPKSSKATVPSATVGVTSKPSKATNSWSRAILQWGIIAPLVTLLLAITIPVAYNYSRLQVGQPYSIIANQTVLDLPTAYHSRWRGPDYINKYDRFFFQWWNFLVYDAETHDHWTLVYHTTKFSKAAKYANYASTSMVHKKGPDDVLSAHEAIPLEDLVHTQDWNLGMRRADGSIPHTITVIDDDTYNIVANMDTSDVSNGKNVRWNLTFHRVHGIYSGVDGEKSNEDNCAIVSTLFGYHTKVSGWIEEGDQRWTFGADGAAGNRYRGYAAGSWGCKLPAGYPEIDYPWTWFWLTIPGDATATPPTPDIGMAMGTARFQLNVSALGDMYGGFATVGVGSEITSASFATLRHKSPYEVPLIKASTDDFLKFYENGLSNWTDITDESGTFSIPLVQTYDIETAHHRFLVKFHTRPEQYFRLPVIVEHLEPAGIRPNPRRLAVFSDFRACGVKTEVKVWKRKLSPAQQLAAKRQIGGSKSEPKDTNTASTNEWEAGGWDEVVYDGVVNSLNAIEFAYQAPVSDKVYDKYLEPQKFELR